MSIENEARQPHIPYASMVHVPMSPTDIFGIIVRTIGLVVALYGLYTIAYAIAARVDHLAVT